MWLQRRHGSIRSHGTPFAWVFTALLLPKVCTLPQSHCCVSMVVKPSGTGTNSITLYYHLHRTAILILQPVEKTSQKKTAASLHGLLQSLALVFSLAGFTAIYVNKDRLLKEHFITNHALFGCTTVFIFFFQVLFGITVAYGPRRLFQRIGQARIIRIHRVAGYVSIALLWSTLWLATLTGWIKNNFDHEWVFALAMGMIAVGLVGQITPSRLFGASRRTTAPTRAD